MPRLVSTTELVGGARRIDGGKAFFGLFPLAWKSVEREVWKLETRQEYQESGNLSWELFSKGDLEGAMEALASFRQKDVPLYSSLAEKNVRFLRLRPVVLPLTSYLRWELGAYAFNEAHGESIYFVERALEANLFDSYAHHDFVLFDERLALIHDYDFQGTIQGGWELNSREGMLRLRELYQLLLDHAEPYREFLVKRGA